MIFLLADISEQWITTIGVLLAATLILVTLAGLMMKHLLARSLEKLDNSVQRAELGDVVRKSEMQLEILKLEKAIRDEIQTTRHDLRNESGAILGRMQEKLEALNHTLTNLQTGFARVEEAIRAKDHS
jgi:predicted Holliday junction resolvase-like endonuclease